MGWQTPAMPATHPPADEHAEPVISIAAPSPLRLSGFLATALGALGLGVGSVLVWVTVPVPEGIGGDVEVTYKGLDIGGGKVAMVAALVLLVGLMALRGARSRTAEKVISIVMIVAALAGTLGAFYVLIFANGRYGLPDQPAVSRGPGVFVSAAGGIVAILGAVLDLAWAVAPITPAATDATDA
jgi:hypothetical protein